MKKIAIKSEKKKVAITCFFNRVSLFSKNIRSVDLTYLRSYLQDSFDREVDFLSGVTRKEVDLPYFKSIFENSVDEYDEIWIYNSPFNLFGGLLSDYTVELLKQLIGYKGKVYYFLNDPKFFCFNQAEQIFSRWDDKNKERLPQYSVTKEDVEAFKPVFESMIIAFEGDYEKYIEKCKPKVLEGLNLEANWIELSIGSHIATNQLLEEKLKCYPHEFKNFDIVYFGNNRGTGRDKMIKQFYENEELSAYFIGFKQNYRDAMFSDYMHNKDLISEIGEHCMATLVIGDDLHNDAIRTQRFYEAHLFDVIAFIHIDFDPSKRYIHNQILKDFCYVETPEEFYEKVRAIREDKDLFRYIKQLQREEILNSSDPMML